MRCTSVETWDLRLRACAAPTAIDVLARNQPQNPADCRLVVDSIQIAVRQQNAHRPVDRVFLVGMVLIAEPKRYPGAVRALGSSEKTEAAIDTLGESIASAGAPLAKLNPCGQRAEGIALSGRASYDRMGAPPNLGKRSENRRRGFEGWLANTCRE